MLRTRDRMRGRIFPIMISKFEAKVRYGGKYGLDWD